MSVRPDRRAVRCRQAGSLWVPVTVSVPVVFTEALVLLGGLVVMLIANAVLLHVGLAPLDRLSRRTARVDLLRPDSVCRSPDRSVFAADQSLQRRAGAVGG
jgi:hypothetical protein